MSLTSELQNPNSAIIKWFSRGNSASVLNIIKTHNDLMSRQQTIKPVQGTDFALVGKAITYYLQKYFAVNDELWSLGTIAGRAARKIGLRELPLFASQKAESVEQEALMCLLLAAVDDYGRIKKKHEFIMPFLRTNDRTFNPDASFFNKWGATIKDTANIIATIPSAWETAGFKPEGELTSNATFPLSSRIGGADAQIILGSTLIDVRTTAKSRPFHLTNFYQQLSYCLLDTDDEFKISHLVWYYSRQQSVFIYPVENLFKDLKAARKDFAKMIEENYEDWEDENPVDLFGYSPHFFDYT